jgi:hypothetical protein
MADDDTVASLQQLLERQLQVADKVQRQLIEHRGVMDVKDLQGLANTASSLIALAHKTDSALSQLATFRLFADTVLEFLQDRSDTLGEDLLAQLKAKAAELGRQKEYDEVAG